MFCSICVLSIFWCGELLIFSGTSFDDVRSPSDLIKQDNTNLIAIGIGNVNVSQINEISSDPDEDFSFIVDNFDDLLPIATNISNQIRLCGVCSWISWTLITLLKIRDLFKIATIYFANAKLLSHIL